MKVLVVGSGGREHALAWRLSLSPSLEELHACPGNPGLASLGECHSTLADDVEGLAQLAANLAVDLVVVGPELPLREGLADRLHADSIRVLGPGREAAKIEWSKAFAKELMASIGVPTAPFRVFTEPGAAIRFVEGRREPVVVKADGLAAGKGAKVCGSRSDAVQAIEDFMVRGVMGDAGRTVVIEDKLEGREVTVQALVDGDEVRLLAPSCDHKPLYDGDKGPNTGGMGAYAPTHLLTTEDLERVRSTVLAPVVKELTSRGAPYRGALYAGLMLTATGPTVLEFNCRFGDPEAQVVLPLLNGDFAEMLLACAEGHLGRTTLAWRSGYCVCVVLASKGYPGAYEKGFPVEGLDQLAEADDVVVFHAGTVLHGGRIVTCGGRVLGVAARGETLQEARARAYQAAASVRFQGAHYRRDIGLREEMT